MTNSINTALTTTFLNPISFETFLEQMKEEFSNKTLQEIEEELFLYRYIIDISGFESIRKQDERIIEMLEYLLIEKILGLQ